MSRLGKIRSLCLSSEGLNDIPVFYYKLGSIYLCFLCFFSLNFDVYKCFSSTFDGAFQSELVFFFISENM